MDPRTPVLVGAAATSQRDHDPAALVEAIELMARAAESAGALTGRRGVLAHVDRVVIPRGSWSYQDPGRWLANRLGCAGAVSVYADLGVLQSNLINRAAEWIARGDAECVMVVGGEARHRAIVAAKAGGEAVDTREGTATTPDLVLAPEADIIHPLEIEHRLVQAVEQYALLESARRTRQTVCRSMRTAI